MSREELMRYLDGELSPEERSRMEERLAESTELRRELARFRALKEELHGLSFARARPDPSLWNRIRRRITRSVGWVLLLAGTAVWLAYGIYVYATSPAQPVEKLATAAVIVGLLLLLASVVGQRYREWLVDPYRDVRR